MGKQRSKTDGAARKNRARRVRVGVTAVCVAGAAVAGATLGTAYTTCYTVEYQGSPIAYVDNKDALETAVLRAEDRTSDLLRTDFSFDGAVQVKAAIAPKDSVSATAEAADSLMEQVPELQRLYTLTVDGTFIGAAETAETITQALEQVKDLYRTPETISLQIDSVLDLSYDFFPADTEAMDVGQLAQALQAPVTRTFEYVTQTGDTMESIAQRFAMDQQRLEDLNADRELELEATDADVADLDEIVGSASVSDAGQTDASPEADPASAQAETGETAEPSEQTADQADGQTEITDGISLEDIDQMDPEVLAAEAVEEAYAAVEAAQQADDGGEPGDDLILTAAPLIPGQTLTVEQTCSLLVVSTVEEQTVDRETLPEKLTLLDSSIPMGSQEVLVEGVPGQETVLTRVTKRCGVPVAAADLNSVARYRAEPLLVAVGYGSHPELFDFFGMEGTLFNWPVQGRISSDYGYRYIFGGLNFHRGVDIPAPLGTAVHAAAGGTVTFVGPRGSYGNLVIIDHGNGFESYYGHNSGFLVQAGDVVTRGQPIAAVGSTGRSTGPHCHFEVHFNGELVDPLMYLPGENDAPARTQIPLSELNTLVEEQAEAASDSAGGTETGGSDSVGGGRTQKPSGGTVQTPAAENDPAVVRPTKTGPSKVGAEPAVEPSAEPSVQEAPAETSAPAEQPVPAAPAEPAPVQEAAPAPVEAPAE